MLYLPPGVAHHGVAVGDDCTTWSVGFRAPSQKDVLLHLAEQLAETLPQKRLTDDAANTIATESYPAKVNNPGEISTGVIAGVAELWQQATTLNDTQLANLAGSLLTQSSADEPGPFSRFAWIGNEDPVQLFVNGEAITCSKALAVAICASRYGTHPRPENLDQRDQSVLAALIDEGHLSDSWGSNS